MAYQGVQTTIPFGDFGLLTDVAPADVPPNALIDAKNISMERGLIEKAPGTLKYNASALSAGIVSIFDWWPSNFQQRKIAVTSDGNVYRDIGDRLFGGGTAITTGLGTLSPNTFLVEGGQETAGRDKKLFLFTEGKNQLKVLSGDGTSFADISSPATDWTGINFPTVGVTHRNRLWAFQGQFSYASTTGDHEDFQGAGFLVQTVFPGEGGDIRGAFVFKGRLFTFKDGGFVYYLEDGDTNSSNWFWRKLSSNFGLSGPHAVVDALDFMVAGNTSGSITNYSATEAFGDIEVADIYRQANMENWVRKNTSKAGLEEQHALYYPSKKQAFFTYRSTYKTSNDMLMVIDANRDQLRIYPWTKGTPQCLALYKDKFGIQKPMYGDASGFLQLMDYEDRSEGGTAYSGEFKTPHLDFRFVEPTLAEKQKHFDFLSIEFPSEGNWNVDVDYFVDGKYVNTLNFSQQIDSKYLDLFQLDQDRFSGSNSFTLRRPLRASGRRISFRFKQAGSNQSFQISSMTVGFRASGEQASKF